MNCANPRRTKLHRLEENLGEENVELSREDLGALETAASKVPVQGRSLSGEFAEAGRALTVANVFMLGAAGQITHFSELCWFLDFYFPCC
jgi:hypothetical protein